MAAVGLVRGADQANLCEFGLLIRGRIEEAVEFAALMAHAAHADVGFGYHQRQRFKLRPDGNQFGALGLGIEQEAVTIDSKSN